MIPEPQGAFTVWMAIGYLSSLSCLFGGMGPHEGGMANALARMTKSQGTYMGHQ